MPLKWLIGSIVEWRGATDPRLFDGDKDGVGCETNKDKAY